MTTDSRTSLVGSATLQGGGTTIDLPFHQYLEEVSVELNTGGSWTASLTLFDTEFDALELAILAAEADRNIQFSFGWDDVNNSVQRTFNGWVIRSQPEFQPHGTSLTLEIMARAPGKGAVDRKIRSFPEGMRASEIVEAIAVLNGWASIIEPTDAALETPFNSKGESDFNFIRDQLLKQARSLNGGSDYHLFFDEEDTLHFHTSRFLSGQTHAYRLARDMSGEVLSFAPTESAIFGVLEGGGNAKFTSPVSAQGGTAEVSSSASAGVGGEGAPTTFDAAAKPSLGDGTHSYVNLYSRYPAEVERIARSRHEHYRRITYNAEMSVRGTHRVRVMDYVRVEVVKTNGEQHYLSGNFQVFSVKHAFSAGADWTTGFTLTREGISSQPGTEPTVASTTITPEEAASDAGETVALTVEA